MVGLDLRWIKGLEKVNLNWKWVESIFCLN